MGKRLLTAMVLAGIMGAQTTPRYVRTEGHFNGRFWQGLLPIEKDAFVLGYWDAAFYISRQQNGKCPPCAGVTGYTNKEISDMVDTFYRTPENAPIPVASTLEVLYGRLNMKQSSKDEAQHVNAIRQWATSAPQDSQ